MSILGKMLSYYYLSGETGVAEAFRLFLQIEIQRTDVIEHRRNGQRIFLNREETTVWAIQNSIKKIERLVSSIFLANPEVVLDVGANCGLFTVFVKNRFPQARVYAIEPSPTLRPILERNVGRLQGVQIVECAVSDTDDGVVSLYVNAANQETNSLNLGAAQAFAGNNEIQEVKVPTVRLDTFVKREGLERIDVLKVDIQGSESALLRGGREALRKTAIAFFEITFLDSDVFDTVEAIRNELPLFRTLNPVLYGADLLFSRSSSAEEPARGYPEARCAQQ